MANITPWNVRLDAHSAVSSLELVILEINRSLDPFESFDTRRPPGTINGKWKKFDWNIFQRPFPDYKLQGCINSWFTLIEGLVRDIELKSGMNLSIVLNGVHFDDLVK